MSVAELLAPGNTEIVLAEHAAVIRALGKRVVGDIIEIGRRLTECKRLEGHGGWLPWLESEFGWTEQHALNFMRVNEMVGKSKNFLDLNIPVSGLYLLAAPSTPDEAREAVIDRAANGESLSLAQVREMIDQARQQDEAKTRAHYEVLIEQTKAEAQAAAQQEFEGKLILDPDQAAQMATEAMAPLHAKIEKLQAKIDQLNEQEQKRQERKSKQQSKPPIDDGKLSASTSIGVALAQLTSRLTITPAQMLAVETRCLSATGETLEARIGASLKNAKAIKSWADDFIMRCTAALKQGGK